MNQIETRNSVITKREYNREKQQKCRAKMTSQKKNWIRKKDRERKRSIRQAKLQEQLKKAEPNTETMTIVDEVKKTKQGKTALKIVARNMTKQGRYTKTYISQTFKIHRRTIQEKHNNLRRKTKINVERIKEFYLKPDISRVVPQRRYATKDGPGYFLQMSIKESHSKYVQNYDDSVSFSTFAALRPKNVRKLNSTHREYCVCGYCLNVRQKLLVLERAVPQSSCHKQINETEIFNILLCAKPFSERYHDRKCVDGQCTKCQNYSSTLQERYRTIPDDKTLSNREVRHFLTIAT